MVVSSPLTSPGSYSGSPNVGKRNANRKRRLVASDDEEDQEQPVASSSSRRRLTTRARTMESDEDDALKALEEDLDIEIDDIPPESQDHSEDDRPTKRNKTTRVGNGKGKSKASSRQGNQAAPKRSSRTKKAKKVEDDFGVASEEDEEFQADFDEAEEEALPEEEEDYSDEEAYNGRKSSAKGKAGARSRKGAGKQSNRSRKSEEPTFNFRNEGKIVAQTQAAGTSKGSKPDHLNFDDMDVDVVGEGSQPTEGGPTSARGSSPPVMGSREELVLKKRKLPTIKKNKPTGSGEKGKEGAETGPKGILEEVASATSSRQPAARMGVADLDLMNKNIYDQLFKGGGSSLKSEREAKEAQRKRELNAMKEEWKAKRAAEEQETPPFDLQAQNDKISCFEERLRSSHSGALYPHYMAGKWREQYERNRARERPAAEPQHPMNGNPAATGVVM